MMTSRMQTSMAENHPLRQRVRRYWVLDSSPTISIFQNSKGCDLNVIGFGLYHHADSSEKWQPMKQKALADTVGRINGLDEERLLQNFEGSINQIKNCYAESNKFFAHVSNSELAKMFAKDACFILNFFTPCNLRDDEILTKWITEDIIILENQIPLFLLLKIMELEYTNSGEAVSKLAEMLTNYLPFHTLLPFAMSREEIFPCIRDLLMAQDERRKCHHLLHLLSNSIRHFLSRGSQPSSIGGTRTPVLPIHSHYYLEELTEYNIKFAADSRVKFQPRWIRASILHLPQIYLDEAREPFLANVMEFAVKRRDQKLICDLMYLLKCIVKEKNELHFREEGIIQGESGIGMTFSGRICTLCEHFTNDPGQYRELINDLHRHCKCFLNRLICVVCKNIAWWTCVTLGVTILLGVLDLVKK